MLKLVSDSYYNEIKIKPEVHYNNFKYIRIIPKGDKVYLWFNPKSNKPILIREKFKEKFEIIKETYNNKCQPSSLYSGENGTLLYGTIFTHESEKFYSIENIFFYKNRNISGTNWRNKFKNITNCLQSKDIQKCFNKMNILSTLTEIIENEEGLIERFPANAYSIQYLFSNSNIVYYQPITNSNNENRIEREFTVKACIHHDHYNLYDDENKKEYIGNAYIPDYKTSVYMNSKFRKIRENDNLDLLEESEDEEDFENISHDKFVDLEKKERLWFSFDKTHSLWKPIIKI